MSTHRRRPRLGRRHAEQLLDGRATGHDDLAALLAAARGPAAPAAPIGSLGSSGPDGELPGERAALAAFRAASGSSPGALAGAGSHHLEETASVRTLTMRRLLAGKVAVVGALTAVTIGGVAFAATSVLPSGSDGAGSAGGRHGASPGPTATSSATPTQRPSATGTGRHTAPGTVRPTASGRPSIVRPGLDPRAMLLIDCRLWRSLDGKARFEDGARARRFADLLKAAGGAAKVSAFCERIILDLCDDGLPVTRGVSPTRMPGVLPGCPIRPTRSPSDRPTISPRPTRIPPVPPVPTHTDPHATPSGAPEPTLTTLPAVPRP
jgi:hypothetical protein